MKLLIFCGLLLLSACTQNVCQVFPIEQPVGEEYYNMSYSCNEISVMIEQDAFPSTSVMQNMTLVYFRSGTQEGPCIESWKLPQNQKWIVERLMTKQEYVDYYYEKCKV